MNTTISLSAILIILFSISCNNRSESALQSSKGLYYFTNLDQYTGFVNLNSQVLKSPNAHSGEWVNLVDTTYRCGFTFNLRKEKISGKNLKNAQVTCWIYANEANAECSLVCSADTGGTTVYYYNTINVSKELSETRQWIKVSGTFEFPQNLPEFVDIKIYPYNSNKTPFYMDDLSIQFTED